MTTNNLWYSDQSTWQQVSLAYTYDSTNASPGLITGYWKRVRKISVYNSGSWQEVVTYPNFEQILALMGTALSGGEPEATLFNEVINGRKFGDINNSGTFSLADSTAFLSYTLQIWIGSTNLARKQYIEGTMLPTMMADQSKYGVFFAGV